MVKKTALLTACLLATSVLAEENGEEDVYRLEKTQITATRVESSELEIPADVDTITEEEIEMERQFNLVEYLEGLAGVQALTKNGTDVRLIIRGVGTRSSGTRGISVLVDGVPITDPDGFTKMTIIDPQFLEQIEIVKGPNSTLYGANAVGGVVNFRTVSPFRFQGFKAKAGYGNYGTYLYQLMYGGNNGDSLFYLADFSYRKTDGWREWSRSESFQTTAKLGWLIDDQTSFETSFSFTKADQQIPGSLTKEEFEEDPTQQGMSTPWIKSGRYSRLFLWNNKFTKQLSDDLTAKATLYLQHRTYYNPGNSGDGDSYTGGIDAQLEYKHTLFGRKSLLITGIQGKYDQTEQTNYTYDICLLENGTIDYCVNATSKNPIKYVLTDSKGEIYDDQENKNYAIGVFLQETVNFTEKMMFDLGVRLDQVKYDIEKTSYYSYNSTSGTYKELNPPTYSSTSKTWNYFSPRISLLYKWFPWLSTYATFSTGFQTPQDKQVLTNPDLKPSKTYNYEAGLKMVKNRFAVSSAVFFMITKDDIIQTYDPVEEIKTYVNAGKTHKSGFEIEGKFLLMDGLLIGGSFTYYDFRYKDFVYTTKDPNTGEVITVDLSDKWIYFTPKYMYSLYTMGRFKNGFRFKVEVNTWGPYYADNLNTEKYWGYRNITNLMIGYEHGKKWSISFDVRNLFDRKYATEYLKKDFYAEDQSPYYITPAAPRTYVVSATYKF